MLQKLRGETLPVRMTRRLYDDVHKSTGGQAKVRENLLQEKQSLTKKDKVSGFRYQQKKTNLAARSGYHQYISSSGDRLLLNTSWFRLC
jgi:hypothetical protein